MKVNAWEKTNYKFSKTVKPSISTHPGEKNIIGLYVDVQPRCNHVCEWHQ